MPGNHGYSVSSVLILGTPAYQFLDMITKKVVNATLTLVVTCEF